MLQLRHTSSTSSVPAHRLVLLRHKPVLRSRSSHQLRSSVRCITPVAFVPSPRHPTKTASISKALAVKITTADVPRPVAIRHVRRMQTCPPQVLRDPLAIVCQPPGSPSVFSRRVVRTTSPLRLVRTKSICQPLPPAQIESPPLRRHRPRAKTCPALPQIWQAFNQSSRSSLHSTCSTTLVASPLNDPASPDIAWLGLESRICSPSSLDSNTRSTSTPPTATGSCVDDFDISFSLSTTPPAAGSTGDQPRTPTSLDDDKYEESMLSPPRQLREALLTARTVGLDDTNDLVAAAERAMNKWDVMLDETLTDLRNAIAEAKAVSPPYPDIMRLTEIKEHLTSSLAAAMDIPFRETEVHDLELPVAQEQRRRVHNIIEDTKGKVRVYCRVRPLSTKEQNAGDSTVLQSTDDMTLLLPDGNTFACDGIYSPGSQEQIFNDCRDLVQSAVDGKNVTIFSYGNTGTGKTYTMYGKSNEDGIAQRAIREVFNLSKGLGDDCSVEISASMLELYNDRLIDLQGKKGETHKLRVRQDGAGTVRVEGLQELKAKDSSELMDIFRSGVKQRIMTGNAMNVESSRSHVIFTVKVETVNVSTEEVLAGKIVLCDLGGSEQLKRTEVDGQQKKEAIELNKSLTALGDVIHAVATKQRSIPHRNHKLTQLLRDSIGGSAKTLMIVTCSPAASNLSQTTMSLKYAARAKMITNAGLSSWSPREQKSYSTPSAHRDSLESGIAMIRMMSA